MIDDIFKNFVVCCGILKENKLCVFILKLKNIIVQNFSIDYNYKTFMDQ